MKPSTFQRWLFELINLVLVLCFPIPIAVLLNLVFHYDLVWVVFLLCPSALGYLAGRLTLHANAGLAQIGCFGVAGLAAGSCVLLLQFFAGGFQAHLVGNLFFVALNALASLFFYFCARKAGYTIYSPMSTSGILLHLAVLLVQAAMGTSEQIRTISAWTAIVFFLLSLYALNAQGLRKSVYAKDKTQSARLPRGIQMSSFLLVTGFILLAWLLSWLGPAIPAFAGMVGRGLLAIVRAIGSVLGLIDRLTDQATAVPAQTKPAEAEGPSLFEDGARDHSDLGNSLVGIFGIVVAIILGVALLVLVYQKFLKGLKSIQDLLARLRGAFQPERDDDDYVDETESLFSWKQALESATEGIRGVLHKLTDRPQKFDDFQDGRLKIRFVYQQLLRQRMAEENGTSGQYETPNELQTHLSPESGHFMGVYNAVRYDGAAPDDAALSEAKSLLSRK